MNLNQKQDLQLQARYPTYINVNNTTSQVKLIDKNQQS
jgi:hypothetical protein